MIRTARLSLPLSLLWLKRCHQENKGTLVGPDPSCSPCHPFQWPLPAVKLLLTSLSRLLLVKKLLSLKSGLCWALLKKLWGKSFEA